MSTTPPENKLQSVRQKLSAMLHDPENPLAGIFEKVEKTIKLKREYLFIGFVVILVLYLVVGHGTGLLVNLIGFVYPAYKSCKAIDSEETDDDTQWLTYWVVYAFFGLIEVFTDILLSWIPFYFLGKCAFLIWCMMPMANNGASVVYHSIIRPFIKKHEKTFEKAIDITSQLAKEGAKDAFGAIKDAAGNISLKDVQRLQQKTTELHQQFGGDEKEEEQKEDDKKDQ